MMRQFLAVSVVVLSMSVHSMARGQDQLFLNMPELRGESTDAQHAGEIDVLAWSWGMSSSASTHFGGGGAAGAANVQDLTISKFSDSATPGLVEAILSGRHFGQAILTVRSGGEMGVDYFKINMSNVIVTSLGTGASQGDERLVESVTLNFQSFCLDYQPIDIAGGTSGSPIRTCYDIAAQQ